MISSNKATKAQNSENRDQQPDTRGTETTNSQTSRPDLSEYQQIHANNLAPRIAVLVDTSNEWGRRLVKGVSCFAVKNGNWKLWVDPKGQLNLPRNWNGDGIIASIDCAANAQLLFAQNCAIVNVSAGEFHEFQIPTVTSNVESVAEHAISHFSHRGLKHFAFVGPLHLPSVRKQAAAFQAKIWNLGLVCDMFDSVVETNVVEGWHERRQNLISWLLKLPKPIGVFAWKTNSAIEVLDACSNNGISVPENMSVLAGDDDALLCNTTTPTLSGVLTASEQIGFVAASRLDQMIAMRQNGNWEREGVAANDTQVIDPIMVTARQSTDALAINDSDLLAAVRFIRRNACGGITVQAVADSVPIGRRSLERKFKDSFGRTPLDEIQRLRLGRVRELLIQTDLPISKIANDAGFGTPEYMTTMFKCRFGLTPLKFRSQSRAR